MWYPEIEPSIGRSLKKAKGEKKEEKEENKYFLAFRRKAKITTSYFLTKVQDIFEYFNFSLCSTSVALYIVYWKKS